MVDLFWIFNTHQQSTAMVYIRAKHKLPSHKRKSGSQFKQSSQKLTCKYLYFAHLQLNKKICSKSSKSLCLIIMRPKHNSSNHTLNSGWGGFGWMKWQIENRKVKFLTAGQACKATLWSQSIVGVFSIVLMRFLLSVQPACNVTHFSFQVILWY